MMKFAQFRAWSAGGLLLAALIAVITGVAVPTVATAATPPVGPDLVKPAPRPRAAGAFPVIEPFGSSTTNNPNWVLSGSARLTSEGSGWLELTPAQTSRAGTALLNQAFPSDLGVVAQFGYAMHDGVGFADGFSVYFIDGTAAPSVGAVGGGLGYACTNGATGPGPCTAPYPGVTSGYVGVGFDRWGNFSSTSTGNNTGPGQQSDMVAVRGSGSGLTGFRYLTAVSPPGGLRATRAEERLVQVRLLPQPDGRELLQVAMNSGPGTPLVTLIDSYDLAAAQDQIPLPPTLKIGLSASTGGYTQVHEIHNLTVNPPGDLATSIIGPTTAQVGQQATYTVKARNLGPNDATGATATATVPAGITGVTWTCTPDSAQATCHTGSGSGNNVSTPVDLAVGASATITIHGTVAAPLGTSLTTSAAITESLDRVDINPADNTATTQTVIPGPPDQPAAPTVVAGESSAQVQWIAPSTNGAAITGYTVTASPGGLTCQAPAAKTSCVIVGLTNGQAYTFTVVAHSSAGNSTPSSPAAGTPAEEPGSHLDVNHATVPAGGTVVVSAHGYQPGTPVRFYAGSKYLSSVPADSNGLAVLTVPLPDTLTGTQTILAVGTGASGKPLAQQTAFTVTVATPGPGELPKTGLYWHLYGFLGGALVMLGLLLLLLTSRLRRVGLPTAQDHGHQPSP